MIRVATFNTLFGGHDDFGLGAGDRWRKQVPFLKRFEADVLALQESAISAAPRPPLSRPSRRPPGRPSPAASRRRTRRRIRAVRCTTSSARPEAGTAAPAGRLLSRPHRLTALAGPSGNGGPLDGSES